MYQQFVQEKQLQWASILAEQDYDIPDKPEVLGKIVGVDLGLKDFAIFSDGTKIVNPRFAEHYAHKIKAAQRHLSRKHKGSKRYEKQRLKLARLHKRVKYLRHEFVHSLVNGLLSENQTICLETLNVKKMMQGSKLARSIASASWAEFIRVLKYKAIWLESSINYHCKNKEMLLACVDKNRKQDIMEHSFTFFYSTPC